MYLNAKELLVEIDSGNAFFLMSKGILIYIIKMQLAGTAFLRYNRVTIHGMDFMY